MQDRGSQLQGGLRVQNNGRSSVKPQGLRRKSRGQGRSLWWRRWFRGGRLELHQHNIAGAPMARFAIQNTNVIRKLGQRATKVELRRTPACQVQRPLVVCHQVQLVDAAQTQVAQTLDLRDVGVLRVQAVGIVEGQVQPGGDPF